MDPASARRRNARPRHPHDAPRQRPASASRARDHGNVHAMLNEGASVAAKLEETVRAIRARATLDPKVGVILGSGLGAFADGLRELVKVPYSELPHLPASKVVGHAGNLCFGYVDDTPVVCMQGRV